MRKIYGVFILILIISACNNPSSIEHNQYPTKGTLKGCYKLLTYQTQEDTIYEKMEGVEILKFFSDSQWVSPAYLTKNNKVVNTAGGTYTFENGLMKETLRYHSKDTSNYGLTTMYTLVFKNDTLHQSGVYKKGTPDEWKIEEYWLKIE